MSPKRAEVMIIKQALRIIVLLFKSAEGVLYEISPWAGNHQLVDAGIIR
jgi:hypothetical protein